MSEAISFVDDHPVSLDRGATRLPRPLRADDANSRGIARALAWDGIVHVLNLEDHPRLCRVQRNRGQRQAPVLRRARTRDDQDAAGCGAGSNRGGT